MLDDGRRVTVELFDALLAEELASLRARLGDGAFERGHYPRAAELFANISKDETFADFLTLVAYEEID